MQLLNPSSIDRLSSRRFPVALGAAEYERLKLLSGQDRILMEMRLNNGLTHRQIGAAVGLAAGQVSRRLRDVLDRLRDPLVWALTDPRCNLPESARRIGRDFFLQGQTMTRIAHRRGIPRRQVDLTIAYIRGWKLGLSHQLRGNDG